MHVSHNSWSTILSHILVSILVCVYYVTHCPCEESRESVVGFSKVLKSNFWLDSLIEAVWLAKNLTKPKTISKISNPANVTCISGSRFQLPSFHCIHIYYLPLWAFAVWQCFPEKMLLPRKCSDLKGMISLISASVIWWVTSSFRGTYLPVLSMKFGFLSLS